ncbi:hypothetical protein FHY65_24830 [Bacillus cereus]|nr:hypothetical protein FHY65_24830 [Bacillus cereus]
MYHYKKRHPKVPSSDLNHFNFNNMYWTSIQILFFYVKLFYSLRNMVRIYISDLLDYTTRNSGHCHNINYFIRYSGFFSASIVGV